VRPPDQTRNDRRQAVRYGLSLGLHYSALRMSERVTETGKGQTIDFSSSGVRFTTQGPLEAGLRVRLLIEWPLLLDGGVQLQLVVEGAVVWSNGKEAALRISRHIFRTRGRRLISA